MRLFFILKSERSIMQDILVRALSISGGIRILACSTTNLSNQICDMHHASATVKIALGRALAAGALMGGLLKTDQRIALKFEGNGPMKRMLIEAEYGGIIRGTVGNPDAEAEPVDGRWNVPGILGKAGFLTVTKDIGMGGEPYQGMVQLQTSEIGDDLAFYLTDSEQIPSAVGLGANLDKNGTIQHSGGFLVQVLPGVEEHQIESIMQTISNFPSLTSLLAEGGCEAIINALFGEQPYSILEKHSLSFNCSCSLEKVYKALNTFPENELKDMIAKDGGAAVTCEFCRQQYIVSPEDLAMMMTADKSKNSTPEQP